MARKVEPEQIWQIIYSISSNHEYSLKLINISSCTSGVSTRTVVLDAYEKIYLRSEATAYEKQKTALACIPEQNYIYSKWSREPGLNR